MQCVWPFMNGPLQSWPLHSAVGPVDPRHFLRRGSCRWGGGPLWRKAWPSGSPSATCRWHTWRRQEQPLSSWQGVAVQGWVGHRTVLHKAGVCGVGSGLPSMAVARTAVGGVLCGWLLDGQPQGLLHQRQTPWPTDGGENATENSSSIAHQFFRKCLITGYLIVKHLERGGQWEVI